LELGEGASLVYTCFSKHVFDAHYAYANKGPWFLNHYDKERYSFDPAERARNIQVQKKLASEIVKSSHPGDMICINDYQIADTPAFIRIEEQTLGRSDNERLRLTYFHHTPVIDQETLDVIKREDPRMAKAIVEQYRALLDCDQIGFQTEEACHNFLQIIYGKDYPLPEIGKYDSLKITAPDGRKIDLVHMPISVPTNSLLETVQTQPMSPYLVERLDKELTSPISFFTGGERRDLTKRRLETMLEFEQLLEENPRLHQEEAVQFLVISIPSRDSIAAYRDYSDKLLDVINRINFRFGSETWNPVVLFEHGKKPKEAIDNKDCVNMYNLEELLNPPLVAGFFTPHEEGLGLTALEGITGGADIVAMSDTMGAAKFLEGYVETFDPKQEGAIKQCMLECIAKLQDKEMLTEARQQRESAIDFLLHNDLNHWTAQLFYRMMSEEELDVLPHLNPDTYKNPVRVNFLPESGEEGQHFKYESS
jgi:trehalose 6-phosphate synthase